MKVGQGLVTIAEALVAAGVASREALRSRLDSQIYPHCVFGLKSADGLDAA